jgi:hypothetical protein
MLISDRGPQSERRLCHDGLDWNTGGTKARWAFPDNSRVSNPYGEITAVLKDGDRMIGGLFAREDK